jgi:hypothetical protein
MNHPPTSETSGHGFRPLRVGVLILLLVNFLGAHSSGAREFRPDRIPNGAVNSCNTCHSDGGGTARNPFGEAVEAAIGGTSADVAFWDQSLASQDSDGDGFTNGQELGDPNGLWPNQAARPGATSPGDPNSFPRSPVFSSSPVTSATLGVAYSYQAMAAEPNGLPVAYGKAGGPSWLSVSSSGLVTGTPTGDGGSVSVRIRAFVDGNSSLSADQSFTLNVVGANSAPSFTSTPVTSAIVGQPYSYQATTTDPDGNAVTFAKASGPGWLTVSAAGLASGTPPAGSAGSVQVTIRATDNAAAPLSADQTYALVVSDPVVSFAVWQAQNFTLPAENTIAGQDQDPDNDDLPNLVEYALKTPPKQATATRLMSNRAFNGSGQLQCSQAIRDDDPKLSIKWEIGSALPLGSPASISAVITDPTAGDGIKTWTFTDTVNRDVANARYGRLRFEILP